MPVKIARSDPRPSVRITRGAGSGQHRASVLQEGRENAKLMPVWDSSGESRISWLRLIAVVLLAVGIPAAEAAPLVPSGDLPGRERYRFTPSPEFMQPQPVPEPLIRRECDNRDPSRIKQRRVRRDRDC